MTSNKSVTVKLHITGTVFGHYRLIIFVKVNANHRNHTIIELEWAYKGIKSKSPTQGRNPDETDGCPVFS